mgnify:CR=1 FL=1
MEEFLAKLEAFDKRDATTVKNRSQYEGKWYLTNGTKAHELVCCSF